MKMLSRAALASLFALSLISCEHKPVERLTSGGPAPAAVGAKSVEGWSFPEMSAPQDTTEEAAPDSGAGCIQYLALSDMPQEYQLWHQTATEGFLYLKQEFNRILNGTADAPGALALQEDVNSFLTVDADVLAVLENCDKVTPEMKEAYNQAKDKMATAKRNIDTAVAYLQTDGGNLDTILNHLAGMPANEQCPQQAITHRLNELGPDQYFPLRVKEYEGWVVAARASLDEAMKEWQPILGQLTALAEEGCGKAAAPADDTVKTQSR